MKVICYWLGLLFGSISVLGQGQPGFAVSFVVPFASSNLEGNALSVAGPAVNQPQTIRLQQVYGASEFAFLTNFGGGWLTGAAIRFRGDATEGATFGIYMPHVQVNLSTTTRGPDGLSTTFSENVGTNETKIFEGRLVTNLIGGQGPPGPEPFLFEVPLAGSVFFYNPAKGNLLLDVRVFEGNTNTTLHIPPTFDAVNVTNDSVSRVYWGDVNATTGLADTFGLPTYIFFWPNPKLNVLRETNSVSLWWPTNPTSFVFQASASLTPSAIWKNVTNGISFGFTTNKYTIPSATSETTTFYRLMSTLP